MIERRGFLRGVVGLLAAPAIVRVSSLMPVKAMPSRWVTLQPGTYLITPSVIAKEALYLLENEMRLQQSFYDGIAWSSEEMTVIKVRSAAP